MKRAFFLGGSLICGLGLIAACSGADLQPIGDENGNGTVYTAPDGATSIQPTVPDLGRECAQGSECISNVCTDAKCQQPSHTDGVKNGSESDVDCGGAFAPECAATRACNVAADCASRVCTGGICQAPNFTDGVKNGSESDVDCGGRDAAIENKCDMGDACVAHADCKSDGCGDDGKCAVGRSCTQLHGGRTCGSGEFGETGAQHESCCAAAPVPTRGPNVYLDKYLITAGRMRAFIERVNGDVKGAVAGNPKMVPQWAAYLPTNMAEALEQLGPVAQDWEWPAAGRPNYPRATWAARGCQVNGGGSRTYYQDRTDDTHRYPKDSLDEKTLNCVTMPMTLAFCLWDGKDLADPEDVQAAAVGNDNRKWPWGNAPEPPTADRTAFAQAVLRFSYQYPAWISNDATAFISAPGRKFAGNGPFGHADLIGNVIEQARRGGTSYYVSSGSWERHNPRARGSYYSDQDSAWNRRYYAIGARCVRR